MYRCLSGDDVIKDQMVVQPYESMRALELSMSCMICELYAKRKKLRTEEYKLAVLGVGLHEPQ